MSVGLSVGWSGNAFVRRSTRRTLLAYLVWFFQDRSKQLLPEQTENNTGFGENNVVLFTTCKSLTLSHSQLRNRFESFMDLHDKFNFIVIKQCIDCIQRRIEAKLYGVWDCKLCSIFTGNKCKISF